MSGQRVDLESWPLAEQFRFFRSYERPHYATTARVDVTGLKRSGLPVFRSCLWAIGAALHAVPELRMRFRGDEVTRYERIAISPTIAVEGGDFRYTYLDWNPDRAVFDAHAAEKITQVRAGMPLNANSGEIDAVGYLSCLPWLDYTSLDNALPGPDDCIPRVSWGKIVPKGDWFDMAVTLQAHHALVHGLHVGAFFAALQGAFDGIS